MAPVTNGGGYDDLARALKVRDELVKAHRFSERIAHCHQPHIVPRQSCKAEVDKVLTEAIASEKNEGQRRKAANDKKPR